MATLPILAAQDLITAETQNAEKTSRGFMRFTLAAGEFSAAA